MKTTSKLFVFIMAASVGIICANLYYAQPLVSMISHALGLSAAYAGLVVTLTQAGYGIGVLLLVPAGDIFENRKLILSMIVLTTIGLLGLAFVTDLTSYFIAAFATGLGAACVQVIIPYTASFATDEKRGAMVGQLMSGLMIGIMLSRPAASLLSQYSWHAVFILSAILMALLWIMLFFILPPRSASNPNLNYQSLLRSMISLPLTNEILRRRSIYQAFLFGSFCLFWTAVPLLLMSDRFQFTPTQVALFALAGVGGAVVAPLAGTAADRGWTKMGTLIAMIVACASYVLSYFLPTHTLTAIILLVVAAIALDAAVISNLILGQRMIFLMQPEFRNRFNGLYVATIFVGGAIGSGLGAWAFSRGGWDLASIAGFILPFCALLYFIGEKKDGV